MIVIILRGVAVPATMASRIILIQDLLVHLLHLVLLPRQVAELHIIFSSLTTPSIAGNVQVKSVEELPSHNHTVTNSTSNITGTFQVRAQSGNVSGVFSQTQSGMYSDGNADDNRLDRVYKLNANVLPKGTVANTGGGKAHNVIQPYFAAYIWKRIA